MNYKVVALLILLLGYLVTISSCKKSSTSATTYTPTCTSAKSFSVDVRPLFQSYCVSCHSNYSTYSQISASSSSIRSTIVGGSMPKGTTLTAAEKDKIVCWIDAGTPNN